MSHGQIVHLDPYRMRGATARAVDAAIAAVLSHEDADLHNAHDLWEAGDFYEVMGKAYPALRGGKVVRFR